MSRDSRNSVLFSAETIATKPLWLQRQLAALTGEESATASLYRRNPATPPLPARQKPATAKRSPKKQPSHERTDSPDRPLPDAVPERDQAPALGAAIQGEANGDVRVTVRFIGYRVRPLDPDNFAGSTKDLLDGLRHAGLISGDEPWRIRLETEQVKVATFAEERTEIEIIP